jgi:hypothetical protein
MAGRGYFYDLVAVLIESLVEEMKKKASVTVSNVSDFQDWRYVSHYAPIDDDDDAVSIPSCETKKEPMTVNDLLNDLNDFLSTNPDCGNYPIEINHNKYQLEVSTCNMPPGCKVVGLLVTKINWNE